MARLIYIRDKDGKRHPINVLNVNDFDYDNLLKAGHLKDYLAKDIVLDVESAFDIETTTYSPDLAFMYVWQFCVLIHGYYHVIVGRTWKEFQQLFTKISKKLDGIRLIVWVHNLGFEYQNMLNFIPSHTVFAVKPRMPVKVLTIDQIEFRCSWKLTNMSLEMATKKEKGITYIKDEDKIDYKKLRFPDTQLSDSEMEYNVLDVVSLCDLIHCKNINHNDNLVTMPLTSTGYVRRQCRQRVRKEMPDYRDVVFLKNTLNTDTYLMLKNAARGGNTHANRYYVSSLIL